MSARRLYTLQLFPAEATTQRVFPA